MKRGFLSLAIFFSTTHFACGARTALPTDTSQDGGSGAAGGAGGAGGSGGSGGESGVIELALGAQHSCLRTVDGKVFCWGGNDRGQLGVGDKTARLAPTRVKLPGLASTIAAGSFHTCAEVIDVGLYCWGKNNHGQLGNGFQDDATSPERAGDPATHLRVEVLSLGEEHSCAAETHTGVTDVLCWGNNSSGQVGDGSTTDALLPLVVTSGAAFSGIATGGFHSCAAFSKSLLCWGQNFNLQCGVDTAGAQIDVPEVVSTVTDVKAVRAGKGNHTCSVGGDRVTCWGANGSGQLGRGIVSDSGLPALVQGLPKPSDPSPSSVAPGYDHTCALVSGKVYCWGSNDGGKLGNGSGSDSSMPVLVPGLDGVVAIGSGTLHTCAFRSKTQIDCWGGNDFGQLGDGTTQSRSTPTSITLP